VSIDYTSLPLKIMLCSLTEILRAPRFQINVKHPHRYRINITHSYKGKIYYLAPLKKRKCEVSSFTEKEILNTGQIITRIVRKVKNVCAYNPRRCFIVPDQSCGVFNRMWIFTWCSWCSELFHVVSVRGCDNERADIKSRRL